MQTGRKRKRHQESSFTFIWSAYNVNARVRVCEAVRCTEHTAPLSPPQTLSRTPLALFEESVSRRLVYLSICLIIPAFCQLIIFIAVKYLI